MYGARTSHDLEVAARWIRVGSIFNINSDDSDIQH